MIKEKSNLLWLKFRLIPFFLFSTTLIAMKDPPRKTGEMDYTQENAILSGIGSKKNHFAYAREEKYKMSFPKPIICWYF